jgi:pimeloyl-ACP methyl ester carboxylesterase
VGDQTRGETLQAVAEDVLAQAPERFALASFSLGGFVAQQILRIAPERVLQLALIDTSITPIHRNVPSSAAANAPACACRGSSTASAMC